MKWYSYLISFIFVLVGAFSLINMTKIWSEKSGVYGDLSSIETINKYSNVERLDFTTVAFDTTDYVSYALTETYGAKNFDGQKNEYALLFNDSLVSNTTFYAGKIVATVSINYFDNNGDIASVVTLNILIQFNADKTILEVNTTNVDNSIAFFERDRVINGAVLKIVQKVVNVNE